MPWPSLHLGRVTAFLLSAALLMTVRIAIAQQPAPKWTASETLAWEQIKRGEATDFSARCKQAAFDPLSDEQLVSQMDCRGLSAAFLHDILTRLRSDIPIQGIHIAGSRIIGNVEMANLKLGSPIIVENSVFHGNIDLTLARADSPLVIMNSRVDGLFDAHAFRSDSVLDLSGTNFKKDLHLQFAKIDGYLDLSDAILEQDLHADGLQLGATLFLRTDKRKGAFKNVGLRSSRLANNLTMDGATFDGTIDMDATRAGQSVLFRGSTAKRIILKNAVIARDVNLIGSTLTGDEKEALTVEGRALEVAGSLRMQDAVVHRSLGLTFIHVGGNVELNGAKLGTLDLSGASISGELRLRPGDRSSFHADEIALRTTRVGYLVSTDDAWPLKGHLHIDGFNFGHLGGVDVNSRTSSAHYRLAWWLDDWAERDDYTPGIYDQLAAAFSAAGRRDDADEIRFRNRQRQREEEWTHSKLAWFGDLLQEAVAGYGIKMFRVLIPVGLITVLGGLYLWKCVPTAHWKGLPWCCGATLSRLLPIIEINKEFAAFFDDPMRERLTPLQTAVFSAISLLGWILGGILIAAMASLTQRL